MNKLILTCTIIITITLTSCSDKERTHIKDEDITVLISELKNITLDENVMYPTDLILLSDSILVVNEPKNKDGFITIYNTSTQQPLATKGQIGDGPTDFINPRFLHNLTTEKEFFIGDAKKIVSYSVDSISDEDYNGDTVQVLPSEMMFYNYILIDNDSVIVYSQTGEHPISQLNKQNLELKFTDYFPDIDFEEGSEYIKNMEVFSNCMTSNGEYIAIVYRNWNIIAIVTPHGDKIAELYMPGWDDNFGKMHIDTSNGNISYDSDAKIYFTKIRSTPQYIFALGWAASKEQIKKGSASSFVYVIDWEGNVVKKINFDKAVSNFCIRDNKIAYVTAMGDDGEIHVFECDLK